MPLPDVLATDLAVVFCGVASGDDSSARPVYYAGHRNRFWGALWRIGLTPRQLRPEEYELVLTYDVGLIDLGRPRSGTPPSTGTRDAEIAAFLAKIAENAPTIVAFNGRDSATRALGHEIAVADRVDDRPSAPEEEEHHEGEQGRPNHGEARDPSSRLIRFTLWHTISAFRLP